MDAQVPCTWLESNDPSYILYTSGTTGKPKGVQRDTGGYAVALASSMKHILRRQAGRNLFLHLRHRLGGRPLVHRLRPADPGMATVLYEGLPSGPMPASGGSIVEKYKVRDVLLADRDPRAEEAGRRHT